MSKKIYSLIIVLILTMAFGVNASTIRETPYVGDDYDTIADDTIVIGVTKF